jgi:hypothetical protein
VVLGELALLFLFLVSFLLHFSILLSSCLNVIASQDHAKKLTGAEMKKASFICSFCEELDVSSFMIDQKEAH